MSELQKPIKGEYWTIEYGLHKKTKHIVKVLQDTELQFPNWRTHSFKCKYDDGEQLLVHGECFVDKWVLD